MQRHESEEIRQEVKESTFLVLLGLFMAIGFPVIGGGLIFRGFEESFVAGKPLEFGTILVQFLIYIFFLFFGLIGLPTLKIREMSNVKIGENVAQQKHADPFSVAIIHDISQDSALYNLFRYFGFNDKNNPIRFANSMLRMFIISILIFGTIGLFITFTSIPQLAFQVTPAMEIFFSAEPAAFAETTMIIFLFSIFLGFNAYLVSKLKLSPSFYWGIGFFICLLIGLIWMGMHNVIYGNSEIDLFRTFIFGFIGALLTFLFGTFIPFYVWHFTNNLFFAINKMLPSNEDVIFISILSLIILAFFWILAELALARYKKRKRGRGT